MRCGCPVCGSFMVHSDRDNACVCPDCLYRCYACQGTGTALSQDQVRALKHASAPQTVEERALAEMHRQEEEEGPAG